MDVREIGREDVDWLHLDQERDQWRAFLNLRLSHFASQDESCYMELASQRADIVSNRPRFET
jgi:hypothetical protein